MSLKRLVPVLLLACAPVMATASHASSLVHVAENTDPYLAYYDGHYGPITDGYWGRDGKFWYQDRSDNWREDDGTHFQHDQTEGMKLIQGSGAPRTH